MNLGAGERDAIQPIPGIQYKHQTRIVGVLFLSKRTDSCWESTFSPLGPPRFRRGPTLASAHTSLQATVLGSGMDPIRVDLENSGGEGLAVSG